MYLRTFDDFGEAEECDAKLLAYSFLVRAKSRFCTVTGTRKGHLAFPQFEVSPHGGSVS